jgi:hypothetical protein
MRNPRLLDWEPMTATAVLAALRDDHRQRASWDPDVARRFELAADTTIKNWRDVCALADTDDLPAWLNSWFDIELSEREWRKVLEPESERRLRDLCDAVAAHARRPAVRPVRIAGVDCLPAGAFRALRVLLATAGDGAIDIRPSTVIAARFDNRNGQHLMGALALLAPGALPNVTVRGNEFPGVLHWGAIATGLSLIATLAFGFPMSLVILAPVCAMSGRMWYLSNFNPSVVTIRFGELSTFGDLARLVARSRRGGHGDSASG